MKSISVLYPGGIIGKPTTGGQVYDYRLFDIIGAQDIVVDFINDKALNRKEGESILKLPFRLISKLKSLGKSKVLIFNTALFPYYILPFFLFKLLYPKVKLIGIHHHFRFQEQNGIRKKVYKFLEFLNLKQCHEVINPCPYTKDVLLQNWKNGRVVMLENSFDVSPKPTSTHIPYKLLYVGSVYERKGIDYLIKALAQMDSSILSQLSLDIVGGIDENSEYVKSLLRLVKDNKLEDIVQFRGRVSDSELKKYYSEAYAFVLPSLLEGYGLVIVEAMSYGLPVIAFNNSAMPYTIKHEQNGLLAEDKNIESLKDNIVRLTKDQNLHSELSRVAKSYAENSYSFKDFEKDVNKYISTWNL